MSDTKVELPATFKIDSINDVYDSLKSSLANDGPVVVDGAGVEAVDFAALQLLMAFAKQCKGDEREFSFNNLSDTLNTAIKDVGAGVVLGVG